MNKNPLSLLIPGIVIGLVIGKVGDFVWSPKPILTQPGQRLDRAEFRAAYLELRNTLDRAVNCKQAESDFDTGYWQGKFQELRKSTNYGVFAEDVKTVDADIQVARQRTQTECPIGGNTAVVSTSDMVAKIKLLDKLVS